MNSYKIQDVFEIKGKGTVINFEVKGLKAEHVSKKKAYDELNDFMKIGDTFTIEENNEKLNIIEIGRFGKLMDPIIYGKNVSVLIENTKEKSYWYNGKTLKVSNSN
jgi:hypothetical protein